MRKRYRTFFATAWEPIKQGLRRFGWGMIVEGDEPDPVMTVESVVQLEVGDACPDTLYHSEFKFIPAGGEGVGGEELQLWVYVRDRLDEATRAV